jgi:hypothetical protein
MKLLANLRGRVLYFWSLVSIACNRSDYEVLQTEHSADGERVSPQLLELLGGAALVVIK